MTPPVQGEPSPAGGIVRRAWALLQPEDLLLAGWLLLIGPALLVAAGGEHPFRLGTVVPAVGWLYVLACVGGIACMVTRTRGETVHRREGELAVAVWARFPMATALAIVGLLGAGSVGLGIAEVLPGLAFVAAVIGFAAHSFLPAISPGTRRMLVMPFILVGTGIFEAMMAETWGEIPLAELIPEFELVGPGYASFMLTMLAMVSLVVYYLFVFAPRAVAGVGGSGRTWAIRFALFVASVVLGVGWLRLIV